MTNHSIHLTTSFFYDRKKMGGSMTKILPGLYVGGFDNAKNEEELMANCISHIIIVQNSKNDVERSISRQYLHLIVNEKLENSLLNQIQLSNDFIHRARLDSGNVLVCSDSGLSANVAVVTAYLMTIYSLDYYSAIGALRSLRYGAHPVEPLQKQLIEFDSETNEKSIHNPHREQQQQQQPEQQAELLDSFKNPLNSTMYLTITSASERERLNSIYGEWPYLEEDLQILRTALNSHLNSTEESEFLFNNNEYDKTIQNDNGYNVDVDNNDNNLTTTRTAEVVATGEDDHINPSILDVNDTPSIPSVIEHTKNDGSLTDSESIQSHLKLLDEQQDNTLLNNNDSNNKSNNTNDDDNDGCGGDVDGNDLDGIPFVTVPINGILISDDVIKKSSLKPSSNESDVFIVDSTQLPESWDHLSNVSSSIQSENSLEIGFELKDDLDDNIPGAIEIPTMDSIHSRSYGKAHTYNNHYGGSNLSHSIYNTAHSLYRTTTTTNTNISSKSKYQQIYPNTTLWNSYNYNRIELTNTTQLRNYSNLSTTAPNCDIYFKT
ncbi:unnamed protein product [Schistosoma rodhaini]|nr:unnamed protein product [Schistosoma rodhaini]